jgi:hypothetical protein
MENQRINGLPTVLAEELDKRWKKTTQEEEPDFSWVREVLIKSGRIKADKKK